MAGLAHHLRPRWHSTACRMPGPLSLRGRPVPWRPARHLTSCLAAVPQMAEDLTFDNTFAACAQAPLNKAAAYVTGGAPRWAACTPSLRAPPPRAALLQYTVPQIIVGLFDYPEP